jgi:hypothetical protein
MYILCDFLLSLTESNKKAIEERIEIRNKSLHFAFTLSTEDASFFSHIQEEAGAFSKAPQFMDLLRRVMKSDKNWQEWKLQNCPSFEKPALGRAIYAEAMDKLAEAKKPRAKFWHPMGTAPLTRVWKIETGVEKLRRDNKDIIPLPEEFRDRITRAEAEDTFEHEEERRAAISSLEWRGLRAARDHNLWGEFDTVTSEVGFTGLFQDRSSEQSDGSRQASVAPQTPRGEAIDDVLNTEAPIAKEIAGSPKANDSDDGDSTKLYEDGQTDESNKLDQGGETGVLTPSKRQKADTSSESPEAPSRKRQHIDDE